MNKKFKKENILDKNNRVMSISKSSICRILKQNFKIRKTIIRTCFLKKEQKKRGQNFCKDMLKRSIKGSQIFFTDETKISLGEFSGKIRIGIPLQGENEHKCNAGLEKLDIKYDGTILPCPAFKEITPEEFEKYNITLPNIYRNLEEVKIPGRGTRVKPLCKQIYSERTKISQFFCFKKIKL